MKMLSLLAPYYISSSHDFSYYTLGKLLIIICCFLFLSINETSYLYQQQQFQSQTIKIMSDNPQLSIRKIESSRQTSNITPRTMYQYDNHKNIPWNDTEYNPVREYIDPVKQIAQRRYANTPKGQKDTNYVTKRGFYMDYHVKIMKVLPASCTYNLGDLWDQTDNKKQSAKHKMDPKLQKFTYIERIEMEEKNRKRPAPNAYNLNKTDKQIKEELEAMKTKKRKIGDKRYFYEENEFNSTQSPGMGSHNPHLDVPHLKVDKTNHKFWIGKHKKQKDYFAKKNRSVPGPPSYSPCPLQYSTFNRIATSEKQRKKKENKNGFGSDAKFAYQREPKKKVLEVRPAPSAYQTGIEWKGKDMDVKKNNWIRSRSTGFSQGVYH